MENKQNFCQSIPCGEKRKKNSVGRRGEEEEARTRTLKWFYIGKSSDMYVESTKEGLICGKKVLRNVEQRELEFSVQQSQETNQPISRKMQETLYLGGEKIEKNQTANFARIFAEKRRSHRHDTRTVCVISNGPLGAEKSESKIVILSYVFSLLRKPVISRLFIARQSSRIHPSPILAKTFPTRPLPPQSDDFHTPTPHARLILRVS